jgi:hypothetical protein
MKTLSIPAPMNLTNKEQQLFDSIKQGMDEPGCGWLHELDPFNNTHVCSGVLGQLISKGLVRSIKDDDNCYWIELV